MEIRIEAGKSFDEIQKIFTEKFPYLKIECLCNDNLTNRNPVQNLHLCDECNAEDFSDNAIIIINDSTTVADLLNQFKELLSMTAKVLRRSNNLWIETSLTDGWTLEKQNTAGKQFNAS